MVIKPLEFADCQLDSPEFRENLYRHEKELDKTSTQIKRIIKEVNYLLLAAQNLSRAQRTLAKSLYDFNFEFIGSTITDDEQLIGDSLKTFGNLIEEIENERDKMLENAHDRIVVPLENFRKEHIGGVKENRKTFHKKTAKFCQAQERFLNMSSKKPDNTVQEADAHLGMLEREYQRESFSYVLRIQEVQERIKFEFVETVVGFMQGWLTFYHSGHEFAEDTKEYMKDLLQKVQKTRENFEGARTIAEELKSKYMDSKMKTESEYTKQGYLFLMEKKAFTATWSKYYCLYKKGEKLFSMLQYNQISGRSESTQTENLTLSSCTRRASEFEKRFCFDLTFDQKPGQIFTFQALSEEDRKEWLNAMDGKDPTYLTPGKAQKAEEFLLDEIGFAFVRKCIEILENRGLEEEGLYRIGGVGTKIMKLISLGTDRRKGEPERFQFVGEEQNSDILESKTVASALKHYLRNLSEPLMTYRYHNGFIAAVKQETTIQRISDVHTLMYRLPKPNFDMLEIVIRHLKAVSLKCHKNKMSVFNLGVVFGPTLLRSVEETLASILDIKFNNVVIEILIENYDLIFKSPPGKQSDYIAHPSPPEPIPRHFRNRSSGSGQQLYNQQQQPVMRVVAKSNYTDTMMSSSSLHNIPNGLQQLSYPTNSGNNGGERGGGGGGGGGITYGNSTIKASNTNHQGYESKLHQNINASTPSLIRDVKLSPRDMNLSREYINQTAADVSNGTSGYRSNSLMSSLASTQARSLCDGIYGSAQHLNPPSSLSYSNDSTLIKQQQSPSSLSATSSQHSKKLYSAKDRINSTSSSNESVCSNPSRDLNHTFNNFGSLSIGNNNHSSHNNNRGYATTGKLNSAKAQPLYEEPSKLSSSLPKKTQRKHKDFSRHKFSSSVDNVRVRTLYACLAENDGELSFEPNQIITNVKSSHEPGWLEGTLHGKSGLIPENYVEVIP